MFEYEIRILKADGSASVITKSWHGSSEAAIRSARRMAQARPFEVWQDDYCVYSTMAAMETSQPPDRPAA